MNKNFFTKVWSATMAGYKAFRSDYMGADLLFSDDFTDFDARKLRYAVYWAMFENTAYEEMHRWSQAMKSNYGLYRYIRGVYNPAFRLGSFWQTHLLGGQLDASTEEGALPILTDNDGIRDPIWHLWRNSNWQIKKDVLSLWGAVLGDVAIKVVDDPVKGKVYLSLVHPGTIEEIDMDAFGNVKGYVLAETRSDPNGKAKNVTYREIAYRDGDSVVYETYKDNDLYDWDGDGIAEWEVPYGFTPLVVVQHNNVGLSYGWSEMHPSRAKFMEVDDLASKLSDHIRKEVDPQWLFSGVSKPKSDVVTTKQGDTTNSPQNGRQETAALYSNDPGAKAQALVSDLDIQAASGHVLSVLDRLEKDYPELNLSMDEMKGDWSGRAIQTNRDPAQNKVLQRRPNYDDAIVRAQMMALSIGGYRGYEGFAGIDLDSYGSGKLDHSIADRPVFGRSVYEEMEQEREFWTTAKAAADAGVSLPVHLEMQGWDDEKIAKVTGSDEYKARLAAQKAAAELSRSFGG